MASKGSRKAKTHRMDGAIAALTPLGFSKRVIRDTIRKLLKVYGDNDSGWYFVEEDYYKLVIDTMVEDRNGDKEEDDKKKDELGSVFDTILQLPIALSQEVDHDPSEAPNRMNESSRPKRTKKIPDWLEDYEHQSKPTEPEEAISKETLGEDPLELGETKSHSLKADYRGKAVLVEPYTTETWRQAPLQFEAGSSSGRELAHIENFPPKRPPTNLEVRREIFPVTSVPKREPCYGWISESEDEDGD